METTHVPPFDRIKLKPDMHNNSPEHLKRKFDDICWDYGEFVDLNNMYKINYKLVAQ